MSVGQIICIAGAVALSYVVGVTGLSAGVRRLKWLTSDRRRTLRRLAATPRTRAGEIKGGTVRITGTVRASGRMHAPLSGRECVAYEVRIEAHDGEGWIVPIRRRRAMGFSLVDETGEVRVQPGEHYELALAYDALGEPSEDEKPPYPAPLAEALALLEAEGIETRTQTWTGRPKGLIRLRFFEGILKDGESVSVHGSVVESIDPAGERTGPRGMPVLRVLRGTWEEPVLIADGPVASSALTAPPGR